MGYSNIENRKRLPDGAMTRGLECAVLWLVWMTAASFPPEVNEAHYLCKARHYWDSTWCANDFFLKSIDAHVIFYWSFGWVTQFLSLPATAWLGRGIATALLVVTWCRLSWLLVPATGASLLSGILAAILVSEGNMAGEWFVGGVEAKGFAFPCVLTALYYVAAGGCEPVSDAATPALPCQAGSRLVASRTGGWGAMWRSWFWLGVATSFHPLVGGWAVVALGGGRLFHYIGEIWVRSPHVRPELRRELCAMAIGLLGALPGLIPALSLMWGVDGTVRGAAEEIYVFRRLPHHLLPLAFSAERVVRFVVVCSLAWVVDRWAARQSSPYRRLRPLLVASLIIAAVGCCLYFGWGGNRPFAARWMRYYWFRWSDVAIPWGAAWGITLWVFTDRQFEVNLRLPRLVFVGCTVLAGMWLAWGTTWRSRGTEDAVFPAADRQGIGTLFVSGEEQWRAYQSWQETCQWIDHNLPPDAVFVTPRSQQTFKWYAHRAEVVSWKDIPQDAAGIVAWWDRFRTVHVARRRDPPTTDAETLTRLARLGKAYDARYAVVMSWNDVPIDRRSLDWGITPRPRMATARAYLFSDGPLSRNRSSKVGRGAGIGPLGR